MKKKITFWIASILLVAGVALAVPFAVSGPITSTNTVQLKTSLAGGSGTAVAHSVDTTTAWSNGSDRLFSIQTNAVEKWGFTPLGTLWGVGGASARLILSDAVGSELFYGTSRISAGEVTNTIYLVANSGSNGSVQLDGTSIMPITDLLANSGNATHRWGVEYARHFAGGQASVPTCVAGTGAGTSGSPTCAVLTHGTDTSGTLEVVTATTPAGSGATIATVTFNTAFTNVPTCQLNPTGSAAALLQITVAVEIDKSASSTTTFVVKNPSVAGLSGTTTYDYVYTCTDSSL